MKNNQPRYVKQYAAGILDYSSQYGGENPRSFSYSVSNVVGEPQIFPKYGDFTQAAVMRTYGPWWKSKDARHRINKRPLQYHFASDDYIDIVFDDAVHPWSIAIYETYNPGAIVRILALCQRFPKPCSKESSESVSNDNGTDPDICGKVVPVPSYGYTHWEVLWQNPRTATPPSLPAEARMFAPILREIKYRTRIIRLELNQNHLNYYTELDAVELTGTLNYSSSTCVDPPTYSLSQMMISSPPPPLPFNITPSTSAEELAYDESKPDLKLTPSEESTDLDHQQSSSEFLPEEENNAECETSSNGHFDYLPSEIIHNIFRYLPLPDFCRAACVCRLFRTHSYDQMQLTELNLQPYWHLIDNAALYSIQVRCQKKDLESREQNEDGDHGGYIEKMNLSWVGGGDMVSPENFSDFINTCNMTSLWYLDLTSSSSVTDGILESIVSAAPLLTYLNIQSCDKPTSEGIRILHKLSNLQTINLYRTKVDDAGIILIVHSNPNLVDINLGSCIKINDYDRVLIEIAEHCPLLKNIDTWRAKSLTSQGINALTTSCRHLEQLDFGWCGGLLSGSGCFTNIAVRCPNLTKLFTTANRTIGDETIQDLAKHCPKLQQLDILGTRLVSPAALENLLHSCPDMEFIDVSFCYAFTVQVVETLRQKFPRVEIKRSFQD